jgi:magnesium-protoporphyrin O-methyltransferase
MSCTQCDGIRSTFDQAEARKTLRRFRRRGPIKTTRLLVNAVREALEEADARDTVLLDVGAGIGAIHHELLDGRVSRAVHVDASAEQIAAAREETTRRGHDRQVEFVLGDFTALANELPRADVVTLDRVICCFDDMPTLVRRSGEKAARLYGAVYPRQSAYMRLAIRVINLVQRLKGTSFRVFLHDPGAIHAVLANAGLERRSLQRTLGWEVVVFARR